MNLRSKLMLSYIGIASLILVVGIVGIAASGQVINTFDDVLDTTIPSLSALVQMDADANNMRETAIHHVLQRELNAPSVEADEFTAASEDLQTQIQLYGNVDVEPDLYAALTAATTDYIQAGKDLIALADAGADNAALTAQIDAVDAAEQIFNTARGAAINKENGDFQEELLASEQSAATARTIYFGSMILVVGAAIVLGILISGSIVRPVRQLQGAAERMVQGDYSHRLALGARDEIGELSAAFNTMASRIEERDADLKRANQTLEKRVDERTKELRIATREAQEASRLKDEFLSIMSHELRTPLNAIIGFQGIMLMTAQLDERGRHMITRAQANANRLLTLINDILDVSRIESGRMQLVPSEVAPAQLVEKLEGQVSVLADEKHLRFTTEIDPSVPDQILIDEDAITKIITNLLGNAFKFTEQGGVTLALRQNNNNLIVEVSDTGVGIPTHMHQIIFERFRQVDGSSKRVHGGSGLGLAIVQKLCTAMDGTVQVQSIVGEGSTFTVTLPVQAVAEKVAS